MIVALSVLFLALPASATPAVADENTVIAAQPSTAPSQPGATAPSGPKLEPADTEADKAEQRRKIVMGVASVVLVAIVIWGRSVRRKKKVKT